MRYERQGGHWTDRPIYFFNPVFMLTAKITKYLPYALIILAFLAGNFLGDSSSDKELEKKYYEEQQTILKVIGQKDAEIIQLQADRDNEREKRQSDSIRLMGVIEGKERANKALLKENERINYKNYSNPDLDSIDAILFRSR